jgi:hypothetical protein
VELPAPGEGAAGKAVARLPGGERLPPLARIVVTFIVLGLLVLAALLTEPWGFIALGFAVGLLVVAGVPAARAGLLPVEALGRALLPLLLPLFVFVAAGVVKSPRELQFAVGLVTLLVAWSWLIKPDWERVRSVWRPNRRVRSTARGAVQVGLPSLVLVASLAFLGSSIVHVLGDSDQTSRTFFVLAAGSLAAAAMLRLLGYARTAFRAAVALALALVLARLAIKVGLLPGGPLEDVETSTLVLIAGALLALTSFAEIVSALLVRGAGESGVQSDNLPTGIRAAILVDAPVIARWVTERAAVAGLGLSLLAATFLLCAVFAASNVHGVHEDLGRTAALGQPPRPPAGMSDRELARMFSPVLLFTEDQRWTPIPVDSYVRGATLTDWERRQTRVSSVDQLTTTCPGVVRSPCYTLKQRCPPKQDEVRCAQSLPDEKAVYVRVARRDDWSGCERTKPCADGSPDPFADARGRYADDTEILVQYWYFYPYNEWVAPVVIGNLKEIHPADWEAVTVGLSRDAPIWVAYSAHCGGTFADWSRVRVASSDPARLRPLVAVANGSQANYRAAEESRVPNFAECSGIPKDRLTLVSYAANIKDRTDDAIVWNPPPTALRMVTAETPPMSFPGRWSSFARMTLENLRKRLSLGKDTAGPDTPTLQRLWQTPMRSIFAGGAWKEAEDDG